jgi:CheY-like chemotaxis protein
MATHINSPGESKRLRILVADDHPVNRQVCVLTLEKLGWQSDAVTNGREALEAFRKQPYEIVLMDCQMPEMDGYEATKAIRSFEQKVPRGFRARIVAVTAHALAGERDRCLAVGMDDLLTKPFTPEQLRDVILSEPVQAAPRSSLIAEEAVPDYPVLDMKRIELLCEEIDTEGTVETISLFLTDLPEQCTDCDELLAQGSLPDLERRAHSVKGAASSIGAVELEKKAAALEDAAESRNHEAAGRALAGMLAAAHRVKPALENWLAGARGA